MATHQTPFYLILFLSVSISSIKAQNQSEPQIWFILSHIKESSKTDYEKWMTDIFFAPMKTSVDPILIKQYKSTRWLKPVKQNEDKTWTYAFFMDPVIENGDYDIENFLVKTYGETKGKALLKEYESFMALDGLFYSFK